MTLKIFIISTLFFCCSNKGDIEYQPTTKTLIDKKLGQNVVVAILDFPDKRSPPIKEFLTSESSPIPEKNLVGFFKGGYRWK